MTKQKNPQKFEIIHNVIKQVKLKGQYSIMNQKKQKSKITKKSSMHDHDNMNDHEEKNSSMKSKKLK